MSPVPRAIAVMLFPLWALTSSACGKSEEGVAPPPPPPVPAAVPATEGGPAPAAEDPPAGGGPPPSADRGQLPPVVQGAPKGFGTPEELYAACKTRVEGADAAGECTSDADCVRGGCSQELCVSTTEAEAGMMSTCEMRPCFQILEACGCHAGVCSWQIGG